MKNNVIKRFSIVKRVFASLALVVIFSFLPEDLFGQYEINYKIYYSENLEDEGLKVQVSCNSEKTTDSTYFDYQNKIWGADNITKGLTFLKNENPDYKFRIDADNSRIIIYHPKTKKLEFTYRVKQDYQPESAKALTRPRVRSNFFHISGYSLFAVPEEIFIDNDYNPKIIAKIEWVGFPNDFKIHNTFGTNQKKQTITAHVRSEFQHSFFVGGDYRINSFNYLGKPIHLAIRGEWLNDFQDDKLFESLKKAVSTQRELWNDNDFDYSTVIITPTTIQKDSLYGKQSYRGTAVNNGFVIQSTNNLYNNFVTMQYLFNHELMHSWMGGKIATKNERLNYWFSEGFTEYYAYKNMLRSEDVSLNEWSDLFNRKILNPHWENPERNRPNYAIEEDFNKSRNIEKLPYRRGAIFAFWLDNQILKKSNYTKSLDDLMREILKICTTENKKFTDELFLNITEKYLEKNITYFFQKHIISGEDIKLDSADLIEGFKVEFVKNVPIIIGELEVVDKYLLK